MNAKTKFFILAICLVTFFANIGALPTDIMESRNIITAREMVSDGCWHCLLYTSPSPRDS